MAVKEQKASDKKYFKLNEGRSMFWDPSQSKEDSRKLTQGQVKLMDNTKRVAAARRGEHIIAAEDEDVKAYRESLRAPKEEDAPKS